MLPNSQAYVSIFSAPFCLFESGISQAVGQPMYATFQSKETSLSAAPIRSSLWIRQGLRS